MEGMNQAFWPVEYILMGSGLSWMVQTPQGQTPAQMPQPMQRFGSLWYSQEPSSCSMRVMAFCGQLSRHILQSRQVPQLTQRVWSSTGSPSSQ